jgi:membrane protease subunit HflK
LKTSPFVRTFFDVMNFLRILILVLFIVYCFSGIKMIRPGEIGIILRFGKIVGATRMEQIHEPGWVFAFPYPVDRVIQFPEKMLREIQIEEIACLGKTPVSSWEGIDPLDEGYCVTGDQNIIQASILAKYQIIDSAKVLFGISDDMTMKSLSRIISDIIVSQMSKTTGKFSIDTILSEDKKRLGTMVHEQVQKRIDELDLGVNLISVEFKELTPPAQVKNAFEAVNSAAISRKIVINEAYRYREESIPKAQSDARVKVNKAHSYAEKTVGNATGKSNAFLMVLEAWKQNPQMVSKEYIFKTRQKIMQRLDNIVILPSESDCLSPVFTTIGDSMKNLDMFYDSGN